MPSPPPTFSLRGASTWLNLPPPPSPSPPEAITSAPIYNQYVEFMFLTAIWISVMLSIMIACHCCFYRLKLYQIRFLDAEEEIQAGRVVRPARSQADAIQQQQQRELAAAHAAEEEEAPSAAAMVVYKDVETAEEGDAECAICMEGFEEEENCRVVKNCGHFFHKDCLDQWLRIESRCPLCRRPCYCI